MRFEEFLIESPMLALAIDYAQSAHAGQTRKFSGDPYVKHPWRVYRRLKQFGITDNNILSASLLHDTIEDTDISYEDIKKDFNKKVADIVMWLSNPKGEKKWKHIKKIMKSAPYEVVVIKVMDRIDNLSDGGGQGFLDKYKSTSDIIKQELKKRKFDKLYIEYMKHYEKVYK